MHFTREPVIETIITPKEGFALVLRSSGSCGEECEEYVVSNVEIVSFGRSFFFRYLEKPRAFLLPIGDYEVVETREVCPVLKKPKIEKSVKVGGGKQPRGDKGDPSDTGGGKQSADKEETERGESGVADGKSRRNRGRGNQRGGEMKKGRQVGGRTVEGGSRSPKEQGENFVREGSIAQERKKVVKRRPVLPPPSGLISEQISRYKEYVPGGGDADGKVGGSRQEFEADEGDLSENGGEAPREE